MNLTQPITGWNLQPLSKGFVLQAALQTGIAYRQRLRRKRHERVDGRLEAQRMATSREGPA